MAHGSKEEHHCAVGKQQCETELCPLMQGLKKNVSFIRLEGH